MKKTYIQPSLRSMVTETEELMTVSGVGSERGITYGGVDENGEREADSRSFNSTFEDDDE